MTRVRRTTIWRPAWLIPMLAMFALAASCGSSSDDSGPTGDSNGAASNGAAANIEVSVAADDLFGPMDSVPGPDGQVVYYTAILLSEEDPGAGLFSVAAAGGEPTLLAGGFTAPLGVMVSTDGTQLFVADAARINDDLQPGDDGLLGGVYTVPASGGTPELIAATKGYQPKSLDLVRKDDGDVLYFTGTDPADGEPGAFAHPVGGVEIMIVAKGEPLADPSGIAMARNGDLFVADTSGSMGSALIFRVKDGQATTLADDIRVGYPAGIALSMDESSLLVSGLEHEMAAAKVYIVNVATGEVGAFSDGISQNSESGGVHRAHNADVFSWANSDGLGDGGIGGTVYILKSFPLINLR